MVKLPRVKQQSHAEFDQRWSNNHFANSTGHHIASSTRKKPQMSADPTSLQNMPVPSLQSPVRHYSSDRLGPKQVNASVCEGLEIVFAHHALPAVLQKIGAEFLVSTA